MKILLDECLPADFRHSFSTHDTHTVEWAGFKGRKNGELLRAAVRAGYEVFITVDHGIAHQHNEATVATLRIIVIRSPTNQLKDLLPLVSHILLSLETVLPGQIVAISGEHAELG